jgi:hypothetical protein
MPPAIIHDCGRSSTSRRCTDEDLIHYGLGVWLEEYDRATGDGIVITSGGAFGASPFVDRRRGLAGVYLPFARPMKRNPDDEPYNDAIRVYFEMEEVLGRIVPKGTADP